MQFIQGQGPIICQFEPPITDKTHTKAEAIVLEGKYWKRRMESVTAEYKKWRLFFKKKFTSDNRGSMIDVMDLDNRRLLERVAQTRPAQQAHMYSMMDQLMEDDFSMDFSDTLFTTLNQQGFQFPNPKEMSCLGNADIIQPGLIQLQPNFDDFLMDTLEPLPSLQEMFGSGAGTSTKNTLSTVASGYQDASLDVSNSQDLSNLNSITSSLLDAQPSSLAPSSSVSNMVPQLPNQQQQVHSSSTVNMDQDPATQLLNLLMAQSQQHQQLQQQQQTHQHIPQVTMQYGTSQQMAPLNLTSALPQQLGATTVTLPTAQPTTTLNTLPTGQLVIQQGTTLQTLLQGIPVEQLGATGIIQQPVQQQQQQQATIGQQRSGVVLQNTRQHSVDSHKVAQIPDGPRRASTGSVAKKDVFRVPQQPPASRPKQRNIAPSNTAPTFTQAKPNVSNNTFLAQLLMTGTCPQIKQEETTTKSSFAPIRPAPTTTASSNNHQPFTLNATSIVTEILGKSSVILSTPQLTTTTATSIKAPSPTPGFSPTTGFTPAFTIGSSSRPAHTSEPTSPGLFPNSPDSDQGAKSPGKARVKTETERMAAQDGRRKSHITAEHKRRCNIKYGFDTLHQLVPSLRDNPNQKISKAATLNKTAEFCRKLKSERAQMQDEAEVLRQEIESLNGAISVCQSQLPATGVPVTRQRADQMKEMFNEYVKQRTLQNWKFYIFSTMIAPLFDSYNNMVSTASFDELCRTNLAWLDQHCSLVVLRPAVLHSLRQLSTTTSILSEPSKVPEQAAAAVTQVSPSRQRHHSNQN